MNVAIDSPNGTGNVVLAPPIAETGREKLPSDTTTTITKQWVAAIYGQHPAGADLSGPLDGNASGLDLNILNGPGA